jgi:hypothetical protein
MGHNLVTGLSDLSTELGENTTNTTAKRVKQYNDAVIEFSNERKWPFLLKKATLTATTTQTGRRYALAPIADLRMPGGIKEIQIGADATDNPPYVPIQYEDRHDSTQPQKNFYYDDETGDIVLGSDPGVTGASIIVRYFHVPARLSDTGDTTTLFPIPDRYRKTVVTLAAAYVQWSRYLDAQGNRLFNLYQRMVDKVGDQQAERNKFQPRRFQHYLQFRGFRRNYPR